MSKNNFKDPLCFIYDCKSDENKILRNFIGIKKSLELIINNKIVFDRKCRLCYLALACKGIRNLKDKDRVKVFDEKCGKFFHYKWKLKNKLLKIVTFLKKHLKLEHKNILFRSKLGILNKFLFEDYNFLYLYFLKSEYNDGDRFNIYLNIDKDTINKNFLLSDNGKNLLFKDVDLLFKFGKLQADVNADIVFYYEKELLDRINKRNKYLKSFVFKNHKVYFIDEIPLNKKINISLFVKLLRYFETVDVYNEKECKFDEWTVINRDLVKDKFSISGVVVNLYDDKLKKINYKIDNRLELIKKRKGKGKNIILVAYDTTPKVVELIKESDVILLERNFILSHGVIMAKLLKKICIMNVKDIRSLRTGELIEIDFLKRKVIHKGYTNN